MQSCPESTLNQKGMLFGNSVLLMQALGRGHKAAAGLLALPLATHRFLQSQLVCRNVHDRQSCVMVSTSERCNSKST